MKLLEKIKNCQNMRSPVKINYFFRFNVVDCQGKTLLSEKIHKIGQKCQKNKNNLIDTWRSTLISSILNN
jgi:hypothetical protein